MLKYTPIKGSLTRMLNSGPRRGTAKIPGLNIHPAPESPRVAFHTVNILIGRNTHSLVYDFQLILPRWTS